MWKINENILIIFFNFFSDDFGKKTYTNITNSSRTPLMLPDEIINNPRQRIRRFHSALMLVDVSGRFEYAS